MGIPHTGSLLSLFQNVTCSGHNVLLGLRSADNSRVVDRKSDSLFHEMSDGIRRHLYLRIVRRILLMGKYRLPDPVQGTDLLVVLVA